MTWKWSLLIFRIFLRIRSSRVLHQHEILWRNPFSRISDCHTIKGVEEQESPPVSLVHICSTLHYFEIWIFVQKFDFMTDSKIVKLYFITKIGYFLRQKSFKIFEFSRQKSFFEEKNPISRFFVKTAIMDQNGYFLNIVWHTTFSYCDKYLLHPRWSRLLLLSRMAQSSYLLYNTRDGSLGKSTISCSRRLWCYCSSGNGRMR